MKLRLPLTVTAILRDETPLNINEPCAYRRVTIALTPEQSAQLGCRWLGSNGGFEQFEVVSTVLLEFP